MSTQHEENVLSGDFRPGGEANPGSGLEFVSSLTSIGAVGLALAGAASASVATMGAGAAAAAGAALMKLWASNQASSAASKLVNARSNRTEDGPLYTEVTITTKDLTGRVVEKKSFSEPVTSAGPESRAETRATGMSA